MIITNKTDLLYDSKNFHKHKNIYTILLNKKRYEQIKYDIYNSQELMCNYDDYFDELEIFFIIERISNVKHLYNIVYGHFYNNNNMFLYKDQANGKIIEYKCRSCKYDELIYNDKHNLICSNSYKDLKRQLTIISAKEEERISNEITRPLEIDYKGNIETLILITTEKIDTRYEDNCIYLISQ